jgi:hypothetical protein
VRFGKRFIIFLRPDVKYIQPFDISFFNKNNATTISIPVFQSWGKYNINDRLCICNMENYKIYGKIFYKLLNISKKMELHSETILGMILLENKLLINRINFRFIRIRCDGREELIDYK